MWEEQEIRQLLQEERTTSKSGENILVSYPFLKHYGVESDGNVKPHQVRRLYLAAGRSEAASGDEVRPLRFYQQIIVIILLKGSYLRAQIAFLFLSPAIFNSFSNILYLDTSRTEISACKASR